MIYEKEYFPQFRESDHTGLIGANGYFEYFQDAVTAYMHALGKGNDTLPETYGICWVFAKYRLHIERRADYDSQRNQPITHKGDKLWKIIFLIKFTKSI